MSFSRGLSQLKTRMLNFAYERTPQGLRNLLRPVKQKLLKAAPRQEPELEILGLLVDRKRGAIDVGGNKGVYADALCRLVQQLVVYEPLPEMASALRRRLPRRVDVRNCAVSDQTGAAVLNTPIVDGVEKKALSSLVARPSERTREIEVQLVTLDELADQNIGFVKIDVEGHEMAALRGAEAFIKKQRPVFLIEAEDRHAPDAVASVRRQMESFGYIGHFLSNDVLYPISDYRPEFQDQSIFELPVEQIVKTYANNFIYFPDNVHAARTAGAISAFLNKRKKQR